MRELGIPQTAVGDCAAYKGITRPNASNRVQGWAVLDRSLKSVDGARVMRRIHSDAFSCAAAKSVFSIRGAGAVKTSVHPPPPVQANIQLEQLESGISKLLKFTSCENSNSVTQPVASWNKFLLQKFKYVPTTAGAARIFDSQVTAVSLGSSKFRLKKLQRQISQLLNTKS